MKEDTKKKKKQSEVDLANRQADRVYSGLSQFRLKLKIECPSMPELRCKKGNLTKSRASKDRLDCAHYSLLQ